MGIAFITGLALVLRAEVPKFLRHYWIAQKSINAAAPETSAPQTK